MKKCLVLICVLFASTACDRRVAPVGDYDVPFPRNNWVCDDESAASIDAWFEAMHPYITAPRGSLGLGQFHDRVEHELAEGAFRPGDSLPTPVAIFDLTTLFAAPEAHPGHVADFLAEEVEVQRLLTRTSVDAAAIAMPAKVPFESALAGLEVLEEAGFDRFFLLLKPTGELGVSPAVEPIPQEHQRRFDELIAGIRFGVRGRGWERSLEGMEALDQAMVAAMRRCAPLQSLITELFIDEESSLQRALRFGERASTAWLSCGCKGDLEFLITSYLGIQLEPPLAMIEISIDPAGHLVALPPGSLWQDAIEALGEHHGQSVHLVADR
jgi:hypothetical protein